MKFYFLNFSVAATTSVRLAFAVAAMTLLAYSCQTAPEYITYTTIRATLSEPVITEIDTIYPTQIYRYPQLHNMDNIAAQDSLNRMFRLADYEALQADTQYDSVRLVDSVIYSELGYFYSSEWIEVSYLNDELISYNGMLEYSGGAHPSYELYKARTIALNTLRPIPLHDLFIGDYKSFFREQVVASKQLAQFVSNGVIEANEWGNVCNDILDALLQHVDTVSTTANMLVSDTTLSILQVDFRDFGCPEFMRNVIEVRIPYHELAPYINPKGYLRKFLK